MKINLLTLLSIVIVLITISSLQSVPALPIRNTFFWWTVYAFTIFIFVRLILVIFPYYQKDFKVLWPIQILVTWFMICVFRGFFVAKLYWEWKGLILTMFTMMIPLVAYLSVSSSFVSFVMRSWLRKALPLFFLFLPIIYLGDGPGRYLVPISIMFLFFPLLTNKWRIILLGFSMFIFLGNIGARSNIIKFAVPLIFCLGVYLRFYKNPYLVRAVFGFLILLPFILGSLGATGVFNIFNMKEYMGDQGEDQVVIENGKEVKITGDTRTFLYVEVLASAFKYDYYIFGRTPARGNESESFGWQNKERLGLDTNERYANEVSILNVFTWTGTVGVILYFLAYFRGASLAVFKSKNQYAKILGLYVCFRWCYAWVEDFTNFDLSYLFLWIVIGLCYSKEFRNMSDYEVKLWIRGIFEKKYRKQLKFLNLK